VPGPLLSGTSTVRVVEFGNSCVGVPSGDPSAAGATLTVANASVESAPGFRSIGRLTVLVTNDPGLRVSCAVGGPVIAVDAVIENGRLCVLVGVPVQLPELKFATVAV